MEGFAEIELVPVEVFGTNDCCQHGPDTSCESKGYGLCDAVEAWSDCNRAIGRIYRREDVAVPRAPGDSIRVLVRAEDLPFFDRRFGDG